MKIKARQNYHKSTRTKQRNGEIGQRQRENLSDEINLIRKLQLVSTTCALIDFFQRNVTRIRKSSSYVPLSTILLRVKLKVC